ncbi:hypothetical protein [Corynebacterium sp. LaCa116]|uniref:hypothetical protein n=1 Tax=Corynebacterium sp. LaCa116 TaxID=3391423 RepID=UPI003989557C
MHSTDWQIQKLHKEKIQPTPNPTGHKQGLAQLEDFQSTPKQLMLFTMTPLEKSAIRHTPTTTRIQRVTARTIKNQPTQKVHWHTIEFSHIIRTPQSVNHPLTSCWRPELTYTTNPTKSNSQRNPNLIGAEQVVQRHCLLTSRLPRGDSN